MPPLQLQARNATATALVWAALVIIDAEATMLHFVNKCSHEVDLQHSQLASSWVSLSQIATGGGFDFDANGEAHTFHHSTDDAATLAEFSFPNGHPWYDISIIPPNPGQCGGYEACKAETNRVGFNVAMNIEPRANQNGQNCRPLTCAADDKDACADAYHFPDDIKTHDCPPGTEFDIIFCPNEPDQTPAPAPSPSPPPPASSSEPSLAPTPMMAINFVPPPTPEPALISAAPAVYSMEAVRTAAYDPGVVESIATLLAGTQTATATSEDPFEALLLALAPPTRSGSGLSPESTPAASSTTALTPAPTSSGLASNVTTTIAPRLPATEKTTKAPTEVPESKIKTAYAYKGEYAGNVPGSYDRVTVLQGCQKESVSVNNPVGPLSEEVSLIFRGPMEIFEIAVYQPQGDSAWARVSSYSRESGETDNLVFMNNKNIDFSGTDQHGPQGPATSDGLEFSQEPTRFSGSLAEASNPGDIFAGMGVTTAAEVNIMTSKKCRGEDGDESCEGFHGDNDYHGWGGGQKIFLAKVQMPQGSSPNQPAIWMLNAQVMHSNQYQCNCRGMGGPGGCGELDIAEVIETNPARDRVSSHYYFYDGSLNAPGGDNWAPRPVDAPTVYATIFDDSENGLIKIVEMEEFDFSQSTISEAQLAQWLNAEVVNR